MFFPSSCRILAVDDVSDNLFLLQAILEAEGYQIETTTNGATALSKVETTPPDLILLDVMMPGMNGYEVTRSIRQNKNLPSIPIILLTAHGEASVEQGLAVGANAFIYKPIDFDELLRRVESFLRPPNEAIDGIYSSHSPKKIRAYSQMR